MKLTEYGQNVSHVGHTPYPDGPRYGQSPRCPRPHPASVVGARDRRRRSNTRDVGAEATEQGVGGRVVEYLGREPLGQDARGAVELSR